MSSDRWDWESSRNIREETVWDTRWRQRCKSLAIDWTKQENFMFKESVNMIDWRLRWEWDCTRSLCIADNHQRVTRRVRCNYPSNWDFSIQWECTRMKKRVNRVRLTLAGPLPWMTTGMESVHILWMYTSSSVTVSSISSSAPLRFIKISARLSSTIDHFV